MEVASDETKLAQHSLGTLPKPDTKKVYAELQKKLKTLCEDYLNGEKHHNFFNIYSIFYKIFVIFAYLNFVKKW